MWAVTGTRTAPPLGGVCVEALDCSVGRGAENKGQHIEDLKIQGEPNSF